MIPMMQTKFSADYILSLVCSYFHVTIEQLKSNSRLPPLPDVRHVYFYISKMFTDETLVDIGNKVDRNHATVLHGIYKYKRDNQMKIITDDFITNNKNLLK